jgi:hypothetical protein
MGTESLVINPRLNSQIVTPNSKITSATLAEQSYYAGIRSGPGFRGGVSFRDGVSLVPYLPTEELGCTAWIDVQAINTYSVINGKILSIQNKISGNTWSTINIGCPYEATGLNGMPCMHSSLVTHNIMTSETEVITTFTNTNPFTVYAVLKLNNPDAQATFFAGANVGSNEVRGFVQEWTGPGRFGASAIITAGNIYNTYGTTAPTTARTILTYCSYVSGSQKMDSWVNNVADIVNGTLGTLTSLPISRFSLFCVPKTTLTEPFSGRFGELLIFNQFHGPQARKRVYNYLAEKWPL